MNTQNWRIRYSNEESSYGDTFFIEADLPNAEENGYYPRLEVMQEDFGDHNGYTYDIRKADAELIISAPKMREAINDILETLDSPGVTNFEWVKKRLLESIKVED